MSAAVLLDALMSPAVVTVAVLVMFGGALPATFAVSVIDGYAPPAASESLRTHGPAGCVQVQPAPPMLVAISPAGRPSLTVTVPPVGPSPTLLTVNTYVAPIWPCAKAPTWALVMARSGTDDATTVTSLAVSLFVTTSPPPPTVAVLVTLAAAFEATFTVSAIEG